MVDNDYETYLEKEQERSESLHAKVLELISQAESPEDKAMILLMDEMQSSLRTNTAVTLRIAKGQEQHIQKFETHLYRFEKHEQIENELINKAKGAWLILAVVLGLAQIGGIMVINRALDRDEAIERRLDMLEQKLFAELSDASLQVNANN